MTDQFLYEGREIPLTINPRDTITFMSGFRLVREAAKSERRSTIIEKWKSGGSPQVTLSNESSYQPIARRNLTDYLVLCGLTTKEALEFTKIDLLSRKLHRPVIIGDIGCGEGVVLKQFYSDDSVLGFGLDSHVSPQKEQNITFLRGSFQDLKHDFWRLKYDYLFSILSAQTYPDDITGLFVNMKSHLTSIGKGYIVLPINQILQNDSQYLKPRESSSFTFNSSIFPKDTEIRNTIDPRSLMPCAAVLFGAQ
jgi:hypothetical protein